MVLGTLLREKRHQLAMSQEELAERSGLAVRSLREIEAGRVQSPRPDTLRRLAAALGLAPADRHVLFRTATRADAGVPRQLPPHRAELTAHPMIAELDRAAACQTHRVAILAGPAKSGRTALALAWAHHAAAGFPDGQIFLDLATLDTAAALTVLLHSLGLAASLPAVHAAALPGLYRSVTYGRRMLLVLDNAASSSEVYPLLPGTEASFAVITATRVLSGIAAAPGAHTFSTRA